MLRGALVAVALGAALVAWLTTRGDGETEGATSGGEARFVSPRELKSIASTVGHPVYWAGPMSGAELKAVESSDGSIQIRYLDEGAEAGAGID